MAPKADPKKAEAFIKQSQSCADLKQLGNQMHGLQQFELAIKAYTRALEYLSQAPQEEAALYANRSMCARKLGRHEVALADAESCVKAKPEWAKGLFRKAEALFACRRFDECNLVLDTCVQLDAANPEVKKLRTQVAGHLAKGDDLSAAKDGSVVLKVVRKGQGPVAQNLSTCHAHYAVVVDGKTVLSSKHQAAMVGFQMVKIDNPNAEPARFVVDEEEVPECVEFAARHLAGGSIGVLELAHNALPDERPPGKATVTVEMHAVQPCCAGVGAEGWIGLQNVCAERVRAEEFLAFANDAATKLEAFEKMKAEQDHGKDSALELAKRIKRGATRAQVRFRRALAFLTDGGFVADHCEEHSVLLRGLAQSILKHQQLFQVEQGDQQDFGRNLVKLLANSRVTADIATAADPELLNEAQRLAEQSLALRGEDHVESLVTCAMAELALGDAPAARRHLEHALAMDPHSQLAKDELARTTLRAKADAGVLDARLLEQATADLNAALAGTVDVEAVRAQLALIGDMVEQDRVSWEALMKLKVGKPVGAIMKAPPGGDEALQQIAAKLVHKFRELAERSRPLWA